MEGGRWGRRGRGREMGEGGRVGGGWETREGGREERRGEDEIEER